jgi:protein-L-isoaspartate(D-aspartate) O-methyltransferase
MTMPRRTAKGPSDLVMAARRAGVRDPRVLAALGSVRRTAYVPARSVGRAGEDEPIPIPHGQVTTQPSLVAMMIEALALEGDERVLEVGSGYGYQTALLAKLAESVWSIERFPDLAATARANLTAEGVTNAYVIVGDGTLGLPEHAPFDAIVVSAAFTSVPPPLVDQLVAGGRLVQPVGPGDDEEVVLYVGEPGRLVTRRFVTGARFVPLVGRHGFPGTSEGREDA